MKVIYSGPLPPNAVMAKDAALLQELDPKGDGSLHFYEWSGNALTYGYFTRPEEFLNMSELQACQIEAARRPTGGGIIFHLTDLAFSFLIPANHAGFSHNTLENYAYINTKVGRAIQNVTKNEIQAQLMQNCRGACSNFCMSQPTHYDLIVAGKKMGGAAQRKTKNGYLHQGSISLTMPQKDILIRVLKDQTILDQMENNTYSLMPDLGVNDLTQARTLLQKALKAEFDAAS